MSIIDETKIIEMENIKIIKILDECDLIIQDRINYINDEMKFVEMSGNDISILLDESLVCDLYDMLDGRKMGGALQVFYLFVKSNDENKFTYYYSDAINENSLSIRLNIYSKDCLYDRDTYKGNDYSNYIHNSHRFSLKDDIINKAYALIKN